MRCLCLHARFILNRLITKEKFSYSFCIKLLCLLLCFLRYGINSYSNEIQYVIGIFSFSLNRPFDRLRVSSSYLSSKKNRTHMLLSFPSTIFRVFEKTFKIYCLFIFLELWIFFDLELKIHYIFFSLLNYTHCFIVSM